MMSQKQQQAADLLRNGFNCSQAILAVFAEGYGLDRSTAVRLACGLGGGCRSGEICGAVTGGILVVGLESGQDEPGDIANKLDCYEKTVEFVEEFRHRHHAITCRELLGCDLSTKAGYERARSENRFVERCEKLVLDAIAILEDAGY